VPVSQGPSIRHVAARRSTEFEDEYYQNYYRRSLRAVIPEASFSSFPSPSRGWRALQRRWRRWRGEEQAGYAFPAAAHVGQYRVELNHGHPVKVAIDAHDAPALRDPGAAEWADLYFKANYWPQYDYPRGVHPIVNGNGELSSANLRELRGLRSQDKTHDLVFVSRLWGGIEHNCRLFEALQQVPGKVRLLAVIPAEGGAYGRELERAGERLEKAGIPCTRELVPKTQLWRELAASRIVLLRAGKHLCLPWRTLDLLAMGSCLVMEADPRPQWPSPLQKGVHYASLGLRRPEDTGPAPAEDYEAIPEKLGALLKDPARHTALSEAAGRYFDGHASPEAVGHYLRTMIESFSNSPPHHEP
jgi:hypothetical protein